MTETLHLDRLNRATQQIFQHRPVSQTTRIEGDMGVFQEIAQFEKRMGLPPQFYLNLRNESDWGFVIKLYSLFEEAATHILNLRLGDGKIESALAKIDFGNSSFGKNRLLRDLGIITLDQFKFLRILSETRNKIVHRVQNVQFTFEEHLGQMDKNQFKAFCKRVGYNTKDQIIIGDVTVPRNQFLRENAKISIWLTASDILGCLLVEEKFVHLEDQKSSWIKSIYDWQSGRTGGILCLKELLALKER